MIPFENYCEGIKRHGGEVTYTKEEYELKYGAPKEFEPMIITPRNQKHPMKATFENSEKKVAAPKKQRELIGPRSPKTDRKMSVKIVLATLTPEERRERKNAQAHHWRAKKRALKPQVIRTVKEEDPQKAQRLREEALARYHKNKPPRVRVFYKDLTPEEIAARKKEAKKRYEHKVKAQGKTYNRKQKTPEEIEAEREWKRQYAHRPEQVAKHKAYREANKQKLLEYNKKWVGKNPQKRKLHQDKADTKRRGVRNNTCILQEAS